MSHGWSVHVSIQYPRVQPIRGDRMNDTESRGFGEYLKSGSNCGTGTVRSEGVYHVVGRVFRLRYTATCLAIVNPAVPSLEPSCENGFRRGDCF